MREYPTQKAAELSFLRDWINAAPNELARNLRKNLASGDLLGVASLVRKDAQPQQLENENV